MRWSLALLALAPMLAGCSDDDDTGRPDGHYVYYDWNSVQSSCTNGVCTYGQNHEDFSIELRCDVNPELSWDARNWRHGSVRATVLDDAGVEQATRTVSGNGDGSEVVDGEPGTWTLQGFTQDANGNLQFRLTCIERDEE
jgi:hypothetical protein